MSTVTFEDLTHDEKRDLLIRETKRLVHRAGLMLGRLFVLGGLVTCLIIMTFQTWSTQTILNWLLFLGLYSRAYKKPRKW